MKLTSLAILSALATSAAAAPSPLPFIADDAERARAEATSRKLPIFVEVWAPW